MEGGDGGPNRVVLGVSRGPPLLIVLLLFSTLNAQADGIVCIDQFTPRPDNTVGDTLLIFNRDVSELETTGTTVLDLTWATGVFGTPVINEGTDSDLATTYLVVTEDDVAGSMNVAVFKELIHLPDYPDRKDSLILVYSFPVIGEAGAECETRMVFSLLDQNTMSPSVDQASYRATIREDFPAQYTIPNLQVLATDLDGTSPNNVLVVSFDQNCPLTASSPSYDAQGGNPVPITFVLTEKLDYDTMGDSKVVTCSVKVSDTGTNPEALFATLTVEITVEPFNDETPQFEHPIYNTQLDGLEVPANPLTVLPAPLLATDADVPAQSLTYSMVISSGEDPQWNDYFALDPTTGAVTLTQAIDPDLLGEDFSLHFIVTAEDNGGAKGTTVLEIVLPTAPTTSTTSTTTLTTTPSSTTSTTTSTTTPTTAITTTTTTTESPSTTTCTPCETTPQTTWTTPLETTTTTSTASTTIPTTTTTSTTTNPTTTEPVTCEPCTTEIVTCPTIESTTSTTEGDGTTTTVDPLATTTTVDPSATTTTTTTGSPTFTASMASSSPTSVDPSSSTRSTSTVSDDPLPSSTAAPQTTTTTTTEDPSGPQYRFEFQAYHFQPFTTTNVVGRVKVVQADGELLGVDEIATYYWDSSSESGGFTMDQSTGQISVDGATEKIYNLVAKAIVDGGAPLLVDVTITVVAPVKCDNTFFIAEGIITKEVNETDRDIPIVRITTQDEDANKYCITDVVPAKYFADEYFSVDNQGQLTLGSPIDVDPDGDQVVTVRVEAQNATDPCPKRSTGGDLYRNEVFVQVTIKDKNDQKPSLVLPPFGGSIRVGYPSNRGLQQVVGPVMTLNATDNDTVGSLDFSISGDSASLFVVQTDPTTGSGALYLLNHEACGDQCDVTVTVTDGSYTANGQEVEVHSLDLTQIYDISLEGKSPGEIEQYVNELAADIDIDLHLLYFSLAAPSSAREGQIGSLSAREESMVFSNIDPSGFKIQERDLEDGLARTWLNEGSRGRRIRGRDLESTDLIGRNDVNEKEEDGSATSWTSLAHIYGFQTDGSLVTLEVLNRALATQPDAPEAKEFSEKATFVPTVDEVSLSGWKAAVGVLGALVGLMLLAALLGFVWYRRRQRKSPSAKPGSPKAVSTIGSAYPNHGFEDIAMKGLDSSSTSSNDSVNKKSAFKKAMGNKSGNGAGDPNNNDRPDTGKSTAVELMANPFTSVTVPDSAIYEDPADIISPQRNTLLHNSTSNPQTRTRNSSPYASPVNSSPPLYEGPDSDSDILQPQLGGLRRITPGPLPERAKSSPYLTKSVGDYDAFRPSDTERVASFTPYKGGEDLDAESPTLSSKASSSLLSYKPAYKLEAFSYLDDVPRREVKDSADKTDKSDSPKKQTKLDTSPYAFPVRNKKEPPNLALATPAKPIMKSSRDSTLVSTSAEVHRSADDPSLSSGGFTSLRGSPPPKQKADERERKSSLKYYTSEGETSDSELKKSVAFKVLVDEKHIKRRTGDKDKEDKKENEKEKKEVNDKNENEVEEETDDL